MVLVIVLGVLLVAAVVGSIVSAFRSMHTLHEGGRDLTDSPVEAGGMSAAGISYMSNNGGR